ncbi:MAG: RadC family protein [Clostridia bacterium]|jgi:DNA repair protein RadC|nr:RadC family protein [Clostridia bacterium]
MASRDTKNTHAEHRKRMKARFLEHGLSVFDQHEVLEMLLFYAQPRKDTNAIGHALINKFGSISAVFDADVADLCSVEGVSEHTAILLKMMPQISGTYLYDVDLANNKERLFDYHETGRFFVSKFVGRQTEALYAAYLDNGMHLIDCELISEGEVNGSRMSVRRVVSGALAHDASFVVLAHNHPKGTVLPSDSDISATNVCKAALNVVDVVLYEHYIVSGTKYMGLCTLQKMGDSEKDK